MCPWWPETDLDILNTWGGSCVDSCHFFQRMIISEVAEKRRLVNHFCFTFSWAINNFGRQIHSAPDGCQVENLLEHPCCDNLLGHPCCDNLLGHPCCHNLLQHPFCQHPATASLLSQPPTASSFMNTCYSDMASLSVTTCYSILVVTTYCKCTQMRPVVRLFTGDKHWRQMKENGSSRWPLRWRTVNGSVKPAMLWNSSGAACCQPKAQLVLWLMHQALIDWKPARKYPCPLPVSGLEVILPVQKGHSPRHGYGTCGLLWPGHIDCSALFLHCTEPSCWRFLAYIM